MCNSELDPVIVKDILGQLQNGMGTEDHTVVIYHSQFPDFYSKKCPCFVGNTGVWMSDQQFILRWFEWKSHDVYCISVFL